MYEIQGDIPMPAARGRAAVHRFPFGQMEVGQSFALASDKARNAAARSATAFSKINPA